MTEHDAAPLCPGATIGIVGGGQLGRMSAMAASQLGYRTHILTDKADSPAGQVAGRVTIGSTSDPDVLRAFAETVDVVTFEFENVSADGLEVLSALRPVHPSPAILRITQERVNEKSFINGAGAPTCAWIPVRGIAELVDAVAHLGLPCVLKTTRLGYDGRGQVIVRHHDDLAPALARLSPAPFIAEAFVDFACEISVVVARSQDGTAVAFDAVENRHLDGILDLTLAPARLSADLLAAARDIAVDLAICMDLVGILAVEMFVDADGRLLVNELAPRPHNSGHWTLDACPVSQFDMHIRAVAGLTLPPAVRHSDAVMKNLIGPQTLAVWPQILRVPALIPHLYGKTGAPPGRKMGHVTRLFPKGALPGEHGVEAALSVFAEAQIKKPN